MSTVARARAGLWALGYPVVLIVAASLLLPGSDGDLSDLAQAALAALFILIAAPTVWLLLLVDASFGLVLAVGLPTGLAAWYGAGHMLAGRAPNWRSWWLYYLGLALGWTGFTMVAFVIRARIG